MTSGEGNSGMTWRELLSEGIRTLQSAGVPEADLDARYLLEYAADLSRARFLMMSREPAEGKAAERFREVIAKRAERIPLQQITGVQNFCGFDFAVNEHVLIPRQDTEVLVETVLQKRRTGKLLDLCTGSGCIVISLAKLGSYEECDGADISEKALEVARRNAEKLGAPVHFHEGDLFEAVPGKLYDVIVSNPPYITAEVIKTLEPEVRDHEPYEALFGPEDGLYFYRKIAEGAKAYLCEGGMLFFEIGYDEEQEVCAILRDQGYADVSCRKDYAGLPRVVSAVRE